MLSEHLIKWAVVVIIAGVRISLTESNTSLMLLQYDEKDHSQFWNSYNFRYHIFQSPHSADEGTEPERWGKLPTVTQNQRHG